MKILKKIKISTPLLAPSLRGGFLLCARLLLLAVRLVPGFRLFRIEHPLSLVQLVNPRSVDLAALLQSEKLPDLGERRESFFKAPREIFPEISCISRLSFSWHRYALTQHNIFG